MKEKYVSGHHGHETLISGSTESGDNPCADEAGIASHEGLPDIGQDADQSADEQHGAPAKHVRGGHDDEVGVSKCNGRRAEEHVDLGKRPLEFGLEDQRQRADGQRRHDGDEGEDELVDYDDGLPCLAPILQ